MKLHYYPDTDSLYIELKSGPGERLSLFKRDQLTKAAYETAPIRALPASLVSYAASSAII
jgi:hypothetical protein